MPSDKSDVDDFGIALDDIVYGCNTLEFVATERRIGHEQITQVCDNFRIKIDALANGICTDSDFLSKPQRSFVIVGSALLKDDQKCQGKAYNGHDCSGSNIRSMAN